jgi:hypothetical protein
MHSYHLAQMSNPRGSRTISAFHLRPTAAPGSAVAVGTSAEQLIPAAGASPRPGDARRLRCGQQRCRAAAVDQRPVTGFTESGREVEQAVLDLGPQSDMFPQVRQLLGERHRAAGPAAVVAAPARERPVVTRR